MKNLSFFFILILGLTLADKIHSQIDIGVIGGINIASFKADADVSSRWLWGAGLVFNYNFSDALSLQAEPMYLRKGGVQEQKDNDPKLTIDQSFLEIPLLLKYSFGEESKVYITAGPTIGYLLISDLKADINVFLFTADMKKLTETFDIGLCGGCGFSVPIQKNMLFFEVKYTYGLKNLAKTGTFSAKSGHLEIEGSIDEEESKYKSRGIQLMVGFLVPI